MLTLLLHDIGWPGAGTGFQYSGSKYLHAQKQFEEILVCLGDRLTKSFRDSAVKSSSQDVLLTFDDGGQSNVQTAEVLHAHGIQAIFFIATSCIGKQGFVSSSEIKKIFGLGHIIGSHSHSHKSPFKKLPKADQSEEWQTSKHILEDITGANIKCCSIPGGASNHKAIQVSYQAGFTDVFTSEFYRGRIPSLEKNLPISVWGRYHCNANISLDVLSKEIEQQSFLKKQFYFKLKQFILNYILLAKPKGPVLEQ